MAILNYFPVGSSELVFLHENQGIIPAVITTGLNQADPYVKTAVNDSSIRLAYLVEVTDYEDTVWIYPLSTFYVRPNVRRNGTPSGEAENIWVRLDPGHVYKVYRRVYSSSTPNPGTSAFKIYRDNDEEIYTISDYTWFRPVYSGALLAWSHNEPT